jgi:hypothetical protein
MWRYSSGMILYDSDNPDSIPDGVAAAGYCDGYAAYPPYDWLGKGFARFPNALRIAVFASTNDGHALDVENGDATPDQAPAWVKAAHARGVSRPWVYVNRSNRSAVERALIAAGILTDQVALWVATLDGTQTVAAGPYPVAAVQYANSLISGGHYDLSIVNEVFGPGGGSIIGGDMTPEESAKLDSVNTNVKDIFFALGLPQPNPADPAQAKSAVLTEILTAIKGLTLSGAALTPAQATQLDEIHTKVVKDLA